MALWNLAAKELSRLRLWRTGEDKFRVVEFDEPAEVLTNFDYFLFDEKYKEVLQQVNGQLEISKVTILDNVRNTTWDNFLDVKIKNSFIFETIDNVPADGLKIYSFDNRNIFVSEALKEEFENVSNQKLRFSFSFSEFA